MILNNLSQMFIIYFSKNFFYPEVEQRWWPEVKKLGLPYMNLEDFMNAQIQQVTFPSINLSPDEFQRQQYKIAVRDGKQVDMTMEKTLTITFKLTESYITYFIIRQQMDLFMRLYEVKGLFWPSIMVSLLDDMGRATITYEHQEITPYSLSELNLSYAAKLATYSTFQLGVKYNFYNIWYLNSVTGGIEQEQVK